MSEISWHFPFKIMRRNFGKIKKEFLKFCVFQKLYHHFCSNLMYIMSALFLFFIFQMCTSNSDHCILLSWDSDHSFHSPLNWNRMLLTGWCAGLWLVMVAAEDNHQLVDTIDYRLVFCCSNSTYLVSHFTRGENTFFVYIHLFKCILFFSLLGES